MSRSRVAVWAVLGFGALGICCVPGGAGRVTASGGPRCDTAIPTVTLRASAGQEKFQVVSWDSSCHVHMSAVMDATPDLVAKDPFSNNFRFSAVVSREQRSLRVQ